MNLQVLNGVQLNLVKIEDFLSQEDRDTLFDSLCNEPDAFKPTNGTEQSTSRMLTVGDNGMFETKSPALVSAINTVTNKIIENLPQFFSHLGMVKFHPARLAVSLVHGIDGHYTDIHQDTTENDMKLTALFYLRKDSESFAGGNLQIFPSPDLEGSKNDLEKKNFIDVPPDDNTLVVFRPKTFHHVTKVVSNSETFEHGRFNVTVFIYDR